MSVIITQLVKSGSFDIESQLENSVHFGNPKSIVFAHAQNYCFLATTNVIPVIITGAQLGLILEKWQQF